MIRSKKKFAISGFVLLCANIVSLTASATLNAQTNQLRSGSSTMQVSEIGKSFLEMPANSEFVPSAGFVPLVKAANTEPDHSFAKFAEVGSHAEGMKSPLQGKGKNLDLASVIRRLATSTMIVLAVCVVGLLLFKKIKMGELVVRRSDSSTGTSSKIRLESRLKLSANRSLEIVNADNVRLIIVSDSAGVKSVMPIAANFAQQISDCENAVDSQQSSEQSAKKISQSNRTASLLLRPSEDPLLMHGR